MKDLWSEAIMANYFIFTNSFSDCFFRDICYNYIRDIFLLSAGSGLHQGRAIKGYGKRNPNQGRRVSLYMVDITRVPIQYTVQIQETYTDLYILGQLYIHGLTKRSQPALSTSVVTDSVAA
jgi:hypothetical protein